jgi:hypothetical protein
MFAGSSSPRFLRRLCKGYYQLHSECICIAFEGGKFRFPVVVFDCLHEMWMPPHTLSNHFLGETLTLPLPSESVYQLL